MDADPLSRFSAATAAWFATSFAAPTVVQARAWASIAAGDHTLVVAPTGSGKTLAAFLWAIDRLATTAPPPGPEAVAGCRVLYISPLKALAVDVERNLRSPLVGISHAAARLGLPRPQITTAIRSGDTPADERRRFARHPADILITTPESLFLLLTSSARAALASVETVIVDEVHAVAGTKRGAHLAVSLDRLDALLDRPAQRIGLSATVRPVEEVARFLAGGRPVTVVDPPAEKRWQLDVVVPVPDLTALGEPTGDPTRPAAADPRRSSIWPHVEERIVDLVEAHRSTLVFANSRRLAERLTSRLNEIADDRAHPDAPPTLARAHHGSVSREQRTQTENDLKAGRLPAVVATSSLELGIDMGAVDLVVQVEAPPSVASGLQRVGRAGHQVGATSHGVFFPKYRGDLVATAVVVDRMRAGAIEHLRVPSNPLDVLAQQVVAMVALDEWRVDDLHALVRRSAPFATLTRGVLESVLDMLAGRYPSDEFAELRPRLVWDRVADTLTGRRGAQRIAVTSGGTIPDRGLYGVFVAGDGPGRRVGELDEEMVYESRVGDVITLGTTSWRITDITPDQVLVAPAPGEPGRLPFWKGDTLGRPAELGAAVGAFVREVSELDAEAAHRRLGEAGLDAWASDNLIAYLAEQREATGRVPSDRQVVVERFTDELGDWRVVVHTPYGAPVHAPWALAIAARLREKYGVDVNAMHSDDGIVLRLPDLGGDAVAPELLDAVLLDPDEVTAIVTEQVGGSALFASRFRECAGRALLLPRRNPGKRQPLWQQRQRSAQLLSVAAQYPSFPVVLEAVRECLQDVFDLPALVDLMRRIRSREVTVVEVRTPSPSPFAQSLLFGYVAQFLYEGDSPLAERRAAALSLDPDLLAELLGTSDGLSLRDLLDPAALARTEAELQHLVESRRARDADDLTDLLRVLGPLSAGELADRTVPSAPVAAWLAGLAASGRVFEANLGGIPRWAAIEDAGRLRDALGVALPLGVPAAFGEHGSADPLGDLLLRWARTHGPFTAAAVAERFGLGVAVASRALARLVGDGRLVEGEFTPGASGRELCDPAVLRTIRRRSVAALRAEVEPVPQADFARFLPAWQGVGGQLHGVDGVLRAVEQLAGVVLPASAIESLVLPARVRDYAPAMLDELCAAGEVAWRGHGELAGHDGWVSFAPAGLAGILAAPRGGPDGEAEGALLAALADGGAHFFAPLVARAGLPPSGREASDALWSLVWQGLVTNDTLAPLRARLGAGSTTVRARRPAPRGRYGSLRGRLGVAPTRADVAGRWALAPTPAVTPTERLVLVGEVLLDRYGVVTRGSAGAESLRDASGIVEGGFAAVYKVLSAAEEAGAVRRGYFVEGLGAAQFATVGAVDGLRTPHPQAAVALAASDPAQPFGAALPWPATPGTHKPARKAGAIVVLREGEAVAYLERGGHTALVWSDDQDALADAADALAGLVHTGRLASLTIDKIDGTPVLGGRHPFADALATAGFALTPKGLRLRR